MHRPILVISALAALAAGCLSPAPEGIGTGHSGATVTVKMDFFAKPLPEIPLPNDIATRYDPTSATGRRVNASMIAATEFEVSVRSLIDQLDGWGVLQAITIPFTGPIDVLSIVARHREPTYDLQNDAVFLVNVDRGSPKFGTYYHLDIGNGNYPVIVEDLDGYWENDPRGWTLSLLYEEADEDKNKNGVLDPGEDTDADGVLDSPNYLPGLTPARDNLAGRADALMGFYERETNTLLVRPMIPLDERTRYAVVVTRRVTATDGTPVGSPYPFPNHASQTEDLEPLKDLLPKVGLTVKDVAFAFSFTTQSIRAPWQAVRDGLYGHGVQSHLGEQFPAELARLETIGKPVAPFVIRSEDWTPALALIADQFLGAKFGTLLHSQMMEAQKYIDFHVIGAFDSPQLMRREDTEMMTLPLNDQSWPADLDRVPAEAVSERVWFHLMVPRKEISPRGDHKPAPVVLVGHGYGSNRFDIATIGPYLVRHGVAVLSIDCKGHGLALSEEEAAQALAILEPAGLGNFFNAIVGPHRAVDLNSDGRPDSGGDFWTAYLFHTRDVVRQSALDYMQAIRVIRSFDGKRTWAFDTNADGTPDLAGDFDGDGEVDIGVGSFFGMLGASLGGIMAGYTAALEPQISVTVPIAAGGGLMDVGLRSLQGGVRESIHLRLMGPLFVGTAPAPAAGATTRPPMTITAVMPDVNKTGRRKLGTVEGVEAGDFAVVENLRNHERGCGYVWDDAGVLKLRLAVESNYRDPVRIVFFKGDAMVLGSTTCESTPALTTAVPPAGPVDVAVRTVFERFGEDVRFQGGFWRRGSPLETLAEGMGLRRATPRLRRFLYLGQLVLDAADPAAVAPSLLREPMTYTGTGETTGAHTLLVTTIGDMNVPVNGGTTIGRAAGLIDYLTPDPRYGVPPMQALINNRVPEATELLKRYTAPANAKWLTPGMGVHLDVENFSQGNDPWETDIPRLDKPMRIGWNDTDALGGRSAAIFPFPQPKGQHGFEFPGGLVDTAKKMCKDKCVADGTDCAPCDAISPANKFDVGAFMFTMMGAYIASNGQELTDDLCMSRGDCAFVPAPPAPRVTP